ncbi:MAG: helix-turn-helix domain-containing protein [Acidimicrobiia bacterium]|nr:helix-turn-helix domain-containing protein [Acidimicrobiia bacterium]MYG59891.1 helix-turn-helix domain-containing protein [Acidimicrobiia bacterium]MYJ32626.1 helix-turn-helix domain-containing protein [Acidimicrobiia bacterium]
MDNWLTSSEAAARLGVKRATLYSYVSRGLLERAVDSDGRSSRFDPEGVDRLRIRSRNRGEGEVGVLVSSGITQVADGELRVRGRNLIGLSAETRFEEAADWVWGAEPDGQWSQSEEAGDVARRVQYLLPDTAPMIDRLRVAVSVASATDPLRNDLSPSSVRGVGRRVIDLMVDSLPLVAGKRDGDLADRLWCRLAPGRSNARQRAVLNRALVLLLDHGLASSTLGVRVAASVRADPYSAVAAGLGILGGRLHGAASAPVHQIFQEAANSGDPAGALGEAQRRSGRTPGFGHSIYRRNDPRYSALMESIAGAWATHEHLPLVLTVQSLASERTDAPATIDFALGAMTFLAGMRPEAGEAVFAIARTAGWIAHALEEYDEDPLRFRFRARYTGS